VGKITFSQLQGEEVRSPGPSPSHHEGEGALGLLSPQRLVACAPSSAVQHSLCFHSPAASPERCTLHLSMSSVYLRVNPRRHHPAAPRRLRCRRWRNGWEWCSARATGTSSRSWCACPAGLTTIIH